MCYSIMKYMRVSFSSLIGILLSTVCVGTVAAPSPFSKAGCYTCLPNQVTATRNCVRAKLATGDGDIANGSMIIFRGTRAHYGSIVAIANMTECSPKPTAHIPDTSKPTTHKPIIQKPTAPIPYHLFTHKPTTQRPTAPKPTTPKPITHKPTTHKPTTHKPTTHTPTTHKLMSSPDSKSPANTTVTQLAQQTSHNILALKNENEECMELNKQGSDSLQSETDIFLHIKQKVQIYSSDLQTKLTNLHTTQALINTDQALLLNEQDLILATSQRLVINVGDPSIFTAPSALLRQLDFIGDQMRLLQNLQDTLKKNNAENVLLQQEKVLLHRQPGLFQLDTSSLTPEEQLLQQATVLQLQASLLHNDDILTHIDHNMTTCLNQEMITILSLRENLLHYQNNLSLQG